jgi:hypothetical protein
MGDKRKREILGVRDVERTPFSQMREACVTCAWVHCHYQRPTRNPGVHHVSHHPIRQKTHESQTAYRLTAQERLARDRRQAQHAAKVLEQALHDLGLPANLVAEIEGRLRSQQKLLGKIVGVLCPPLFGCRTNPTATSIFDLRATTRYAPPAYPMDHQEAP